MSWLEDLLGLNTADDLCERARKQFNEGKYQEAVNSLEKALGKANMHAESHNLLAWIYALHGAQLHDALNHVNKALRFVKNNNSSFGAFLDTRAEIHMRMGNLDLAIADFQQALQMGFRDDANYPAWFRLGVCYILQERWREAYSVLEAALQSGPKNPAIYYAMGDVCLNLGRNQTALSYYKQAISKAQGWNFSFPLINNEQAQQNQQLFVCNVCVQMGFIYYLEKDYKNSWTYNQKAHEANPAHPIPLINLAELSAIADDPAQMQFYLENAVPRVALQQDFRLIASLRSNPHFFKHRDIVLRLLRSSGVISEWDYDQDYRTWREQQEKERYMAKKDDRPQLIHIESLNGNYVNSVDGYGQVSRDHHQNSSNNQQR